MENDNAPSIFVIKCPHCGILIEVVELNCRIFRCGIYKHNYTQINPHLPKKDCEELVLNNSIYGCGKPFRIPESSTEPVECDYI
jgi:hypothetical protein